MKKIILIPRERIFIILFISTVLLSGGGLMAAGKRTKRTTWSGERYCSPYVEIVYKNDSDNMADRRKVFIFTDSTGKLHRLYFDDSKEQKWRGNCLGEEIYERGKIIFDNYKEND